MINDVCIEKLLKKHLQWKFVTGVAVTAVRVFAYDTSENLLLQ